MVFIMDLERVARHFEWKPIVRALDITDHEDTIKALASRHSMPEWQLDLESRKIEETLKSEPQLARMVNDIRQYSPVRHYANFQRIMQYSNRVDLETLA